MKINRMTTIQIMRDLNSLPADISEVEWVSAAQYDEEVTELKKENTRLKAKLSEAVQYLREGKAKFAPEVTNSLVDDFLKSYERVERG